MSKEETIPNSDEAKQDDKKEKERKEKKDKFKPRTKIIVRHLPPSMTEEQFISQVSPLPEGSQYYYVRPDSSLDEYAFCRAYILIPNLEDQLLFRDKFDNYIFLDSLGGLEYAAIVEYAPYQKFPSRKPVKELTEEEEKEIKESYENDPAYILFLEKKAKAEKTDPLDDLTLELTKETSSKKNVITTTPLLEFIKEKRAEKQRFKEERKKKEIERKKMVAEEKRKKAESSNYKNFSRSIFSSEANINIEKLDFNSKIKLERNARLEDFNDSRHSVMFKQSIQNKSNLDLTEFKTIDDSLERNSTYAYSEDIGNKKLIPHYSHVKKEKFIDIYKPNESLFRSIMTREPKKVIEIGVDPTEYTNVERSPHLDINSKQNINAHKTLKNPQDFVFKDDRDLEEENNFSRIYTNSNWGHSSKKSIKTNSNQKLFHDKQKLVKSEKDGSKNFQNKNKREEDENHKSRCRDEENVKSRFRDHDKSRYPDDEAKLRHKADRREPLKHSRSFEKIPSKKQINHESKKSYEYQNPKYDQKKPHHLREYENKSYHKDYENKSYHKDYENKSKDYDHKRQYHDDKRRPKSEWKNSKDSKYKDYDSRSKDWEHQGAKPRKKLPQNPTRKEEEPKKILENKNKPENELQQDLKQEEESNNSLIEKNEETIQTDSFKDLPPVVNTESEIKNNTSTSSKSESDPITVKSLDSKSNDSDSTLKEEPINKDPRPERRIRNKDRPSLEIYRPGMGRFSRQRREQEKTNSIDQESPTNSPNHLTLNKTKGNIHTPSDYSDS